MTPTYTIHYRTVAESGNERIYFESDQEGEDDCGNMWFVNDVLIDYDSCWELPEAIIKQMILEGYNMDYAND